MQSKQQIQIPTVLVNVFEHELNKRGIQNIQEWLQRPNTVYIGQKLPKLGIQRSKWATPYSAKLIGVENALKQYKEHIMKTPELYNGLNELKGKQLGCFFEPGTQQSHGHVLKELVKAVKMPMQQPKVLQEVKQAQPYVQQQIQAPQQFQHKQQQPPKVKFNGKVPIYLGIFPKNKQEAASEILSHIGKALEFTCQKFPEHQNANECYKNFKYDMDMIQDHHITSFFIGGWKNKHKLDDQHVQTFEEFQEMNMNLIGLVYVPYKIITGIAEVDGQIMIDNEFPHMTLMTGDYKPVHSNNVLKALFGQNGPCQLLQANSWANFKSKEFVQHCQVTILGQKEDVYVISLKNPLVVQGLTKGFMGHNKGNGGHKGKKWKSNKGHNHHYKNNNGYKGKKWKQKKY